MRKKENFNFLDFFSEDVLKTLLKRRETFRKKYGAVFVKKKINFFEFFSEDVLKTFLRRRETFRKKYGAVFEKSPKNMVFLTSKKRPLLEGVFEPKFPKFQT